MSELEFLGALEVELLRHGELGHDRPRHEAFQTSTVAALLGGAFDGDVTLGELLEHGDLGLGTLNALDGELIVVEGEAWKAGLDCTLARAPASARTPYAVVVPFSPGEPVVLHGPLGAEQLEQRLEHRLGSKGRPRAIRIDGRFERLRVRSVPRQERPYPPLAEAIAHQHVRELADVSGTIVGFSFPDPLEGIEMLGWHLHFATEDRRLGGHVLDFALRDGTVLLDDVTELHVELPPYVDAHEPAAVDQEALGRLETER